MSDADHASEDLGPKDNTDDSTIADMGLTGTPASSSTPVGQGDEAGPGTLEERDDPESSEQ